MHAFMAAEKKEESILDLVPVKNGVISSAEVVEECKTFVELLKRETSGFLYLLRMVGRNLEKPVYKVGYSTGRGIGFKNVKRSLTERTFADRIRELNSEFDCCIGHVVENIIVVMVVRVVGRPEEHSLHKCLEDFGVDVRKKFGGKYREFYAICPEVYDGFKQFCTKNLPFCPLWESDYYVLADDGGEVWRGEILTQPDE